MKYVGVGVANLFGGYWCVKLHYNNQYDMNRREWISLMNQLKTNFSPITYEYHVLYEWLNDYKMAMLEWKVKNFNLSHPPTIPIDLKEYIKNGSKD